MGTTTHTCHRNGENMRGAGGEERERKTSEGEWGKERGRNKSF
jgi:hypothetical protein